MSDTPPSDMGSEPGSTEAPPDGDTDTPGAPTTGVSLTDEQKSGIKVLVVDDDDSILGSSVHILEQEGYDVDGLQRGSDAEARLRGGAADIVLLDWYMSGVSGLRLLHTALGARPDTIVIVITGRPSIESSMEALKKGAWDYLPKPFSAPHLKILVGRAAHTVLVTRESESMRGGTDEKVGDEALPIGESPAFKSVMALARKVAATDASVFITGESGTGKELVAQYIHRMSRRRSRPMVEVNCAALPETLLESEMFGHVKGAFTGATNDRVGLMEAANGGTLFLDELTEMSPPTQAKLLRVVQDGVLRRLGSSKADTIVNVRMISATNRDPGSAVEEGHLREDLYYRLRVVPIRIPPLRERPEDIPLLARHFLRLFWKRHGRTSGPPTLTEDAIQQLQARPWKGNVRELQNVIEHAIVLTEGRDVIDASDVPQFGDSGAGDVHLEGAYVGPGVGGGGYHETRDRVMARFEREYLTWVLQEADGNVSEAARVAGINRATLYRLLERQGLTKQDVID